MVDEEAWNKYGQTSTTIMQTAEDGLDEVPFMFNHPGSNALALKLEEAVLAMGEEARETPMSGWHGRGIAIADDGSLAAASQPLRYGGGLITTARPQWVCRNGTPAVGQADEAPCALKGSQKTHGVASAMRLRGGGPNEGPNDGDERRRAGKRPWEGVEGAWGRPREMGHQGDDRLNGWGRPRQRQQHDVPQNPQDMPNTPCAFCAVIRYLPDGNGRRYSVVQLATGKFACARFVGQNNVPTISRCGGEGSIAVSEEALLKFIGELKNGNTPKDRKNELRKRHEVSRPQGSGKRARVLLEQKEEEEKEAPQRTGKRARILLEQKDEEEKEARPLSPHSMSRSQLVKQIELVHAEATRRGLLIPKSTPPPRPPPPVAGNEGRLQLQVQHMALQMQQMQQMQLQMQLQQEKNELQLQQGKAQLLQQYASEGTLHVLESPPAPDAW